MKIGLSTSCFYPQPLEQTVERIAALGGRTIEIFFNTESELRDPFLSALRRSLRAYGLTVVSIHPFTSLMEGLLLFTDYARRAEDGFAQYRRYFEVAHSLGARYLTLHGERKVPGVQETADSWARKVERYNRLCEVAAEEGMQVAQENVAWCRSSDPDYLRALYKAVPALGYTLDVKQANRMQKSWKAYFDAVAPRLLNIHINDFDQDHGCLLPGEGLLDYGELFAALRRSGYDRQILIEVYSSNYDSDAQITRSLRFLREQAEKAGYSAGF